MSKKVGIVIVNYNGAKFQNDALKSIYASSFSDFEIVIVDSHSTDNSIELAKKDFPDVHYLLQDENVGVAKGNNIGIDYCINTLGTEYVLLLNNDVILDKYTIENLVKNVNEDTVVVPKIYFFDNKNKIWFAGGRLDWNIADGKHIGVHQEDKGQYNSLKYIDYAPTCCMLVSKKILQDVGKIDEDFFMYYDDTDLCVRIIDKGYKMLYVPDSFMWHKESSSSGGNRSKVALYYNGRNKFYFIDKHKDKLKPYSPILIFIKFMLRLLRISTHKNCKYILIGYSDYKKNIKGRRDNL